MIVLTDLLLTAMELALQGIETSSTFRKKEKKTLM
jgi:hypothetical protein